MTAESDPRIGSEIAGYRIESLLGRGGMGAVYRAEDRRLGRTIALKLVPPDVSADERYRERFLRESRLAASIEHPNIVPIHDASESDGVLYLAMRCVDGTDLRRLLERDGPMAASDALAIAEQVAGALDAAHARGLIHRDVKPSNVLVTGDRHAYLADFGVSKSLGDGDRLTTAGQFVGTAEYAAPEQIEGRELDGRADQYSLACILFECLAGRPPFPRENQAAILWAHLKETPPSLVAMRAGLPEGLDTALARGLAKRPEDRYRSCRELVAMVRAELAPAGDGAPDSRRTGPAALGDHLREIADAMLQGRVVPLLGPGVGAAGRPDGDAWSKGDGFLPDGVEVAAHLAQRFGYPPELEPELVRVSEYVQVMRGPGPLYDELHDVYDADFRAGPVHAFLIQLPALLRASGAPHPLIVTTGYDESLERALAEAGEEVDVVAYVAAGRDRGRFSHLRPDGSVRLIEVPNTYADLSLETRTIVLKMHGQVDRRPARELESFVVSEDDYIDYLAQTDIANLVPVTLAAKLRRSHVLFLGYVPDEWSQRVVLHRLWGDERLRYRSWAVVPSSTPLERQLWHTRGVDVLSLPLAEYVAALAEELTARRAAR